MKLSGTTALVTGGTDGIGAQLIRQLRDQGVTVLTTGRNQERIATTRTAGFEVIEADLSAQPGLDALLEALDGRTFDLLINNAGMMDRYDFRVGQPDPGDVERTLFLNLHVPIQLITALLPRLQARPEASIMNVTSGNALAPRSVAPVYSATKAGLRSYTLALREQLRSTRIHVIEALPPAVSTRMTTQNNFKLMSAADCAQQMVMALEHDTPEVSIGVVRQLQWLYSLSPALARQFMLRQ